MPWKIEKLAGGYFVVKSETGEKMNKEPHSKRSQAVSHLKALYANMPYGDEGKFPYLIRKEVEKPALELKPQQPEPDDSLETKEIRLRKRVSPVEFAARTLKHLAGGHNQRTHGRRGSSVSSKPPKPGEPKSKTPEKAPTEQNAWLKWKVDKLTEAIADLKEEYDNIRKGSGNWKKMAQVADDMERLSAERAPYIEQLERKMQLGFSFVEEIKPDFKLEMQTAGSESKKKKQPAQMGFAGKETTVKEFTYIVLKHLSGKHPQKRHGWRYGGSGTAGVRQSMRGMNRSEREEYKRRARTGIYGKKPVSIDADPMASTGVSGSSLRKRMDAITKIKNPKKRLQAINQLEEMLHKRGSSQAAQAIARARLDAKAEIAGKPKRFAKSTELRGDKVTAIGTDPNNKYEFQYKVVELDELIPSNLMSGDINPAYDKSLQPRIRSRTASQAQIDKIASDLNPDVLLTDFKTLDKGPMIVGDDNMVESGNGRVLALQRAREMYPEKFAEYTEALKKEAGKYGITKEHLGEVKNPVLVRERITKVDRAAFARESNAPAVLQMSPLEMAANDSKFITDSMLTALRVEEDQSIDLALRKNENLPFVQKFLGYMSPNERSGLMRSDGTLNRMGLWRIKAAVFSKVFPGESGMRLADTFLESLDSSIKNFENALSSALPMVARAEGLIASGYRDAKLSLAEDFTKSIDMLARLREKGIKVSDYIAQQSLFTKELNGFQMRLLAHFDAIGRRPKNIRQFFQRYADLVISSTPTGQTDMFGGSGLTMEKMIDLLFKETEAETEAVPAGAMF